MKVLDRWRRSAAALAVAAAIVPLATTQASAEPARTATTTKYTRAVYLQHALGLQTGNPVIESVTYDRFQHLLRQPGSFGILIGDPATDDTFAARARDVETTASAAGVRKVYWFNPNLSGNARVGTTTLPNLDIRDAAGITSLTASSRNRYRDTWLNIVAQSLGNGVTSVRNSPGSQGQSVTISFSDAVNDADDALYDYTGETTPADVTDSYFLVYDTGHTHEGRPDKIVSWINLTKETDSGTAQAKVTAAISAVGAANFGVVDKFDWWKEEANTRQSVYATIPAQGPDVPVLTDADNRAADGGFRVNQITYPELIDLLDNADDANAVILFGGTWCPNTRAVISFVNQYAQENDVTVYNFDTVLDGGIIAGNPTGGSNPLQTRNPHGNGAYPSFVYGTLVDHYLPNFQTQYQTDNAITYYPGGDTERPAITTRRLQVPYLFGYQGREGDEPFGGVTRQWIIRTGDTSWREYMSQWYYTNPRPSQINLSVTDLPQAAAAWSGINAKLASVAWNTALESLLENTGTFADAAAFLVAADKANLTYNATTGAPNAPTYNANGRIEISPTALNAALAALGEARPENTTAARNALVAARAATPVDDALVADLETVFAAWTIVTNRKNQVNNRWGNATTPGSVLGGLNAVRALQVFFGGLPGGVASTRTVSAPPVTYGTAPTIAIAIANEYGRVPTGDVSLVVKQGATTVATDAKAVAGDAASFTLPVLAAGTYDYTLSYAGDDQIAAFTETGSLTVTAATEDPPPVPVATPAAVATPQPTPAPTKAARVKAGKVKGAVSKRPTSRKAGKYKVTIATRKGAARATGTVKLRLKKGKTTRTITRKLSRGTVTFSLPKLARGTWKVTISWAGDANYLAASAAGAAIKVIR